MSITVVMLRDVPAETGGGVWRAGDSKVASDSYGAYLIGRGDAHDASGDRLDFEKYAVRQSPTTGALVGADGVEFANQGNAAGGTLVCDWNTNGTLSLVSSNGGGEALALDPATLCDGLPMAKATCGSTGTFIGQFVFTEAVTLAQMQSLQIPIRVSQNNAVFGGTGMAQIWIWDDATGTTRSWRLSTSLNMSRARPGATHVLSFGPGVAADGWAFAGSSAPTSSTDLDAYTINRLRIVIAVPGSVAGDAVWFGPILANGRRKPVVSIVLDGQYSSQHQYLLPMLEAQGLRCSMALQHSLIGSGGRMTEAQLNRAYGAGHELIHHTYDGSKGSGYQLAGDWADAAAITADINLGIAYQRARGWDRGIGYAVHGGTTHPYAGSVTAARQAIVTAGYQGAGIKAIRAGEGFGTAPLKRLQNVARPANVDPYSIQGALQWTSTDNAAALAVPITSAKARGEWAIYTGHRSVVSSASSLEILNSDALTWLQALGDDVRAGKVLCLPFGEACRYYGLTT